MQGSHGQIHVAVAAEIGICESHRKLVVIVAYRRTQQERAGALEFQQEPRKESSAVVVQPGFSLGAGPDVPILIEKTKRIAVFQHANSLVGQAGIGQHVMRVA